MSPSAPMSTEIVSVFICLMSASQYLYLKRFSVTLMGVLWSDGLEILIREHFLSLTMSGLLAVVSLTVLLGMFQKKVKQSLFNSCRLVLYPYY